ALRAQAEVLLYFLERGRNTGLLAGAEIVQQRALLWRQAEGHRVSPFCFPRRSRAAGVGRVNWSERGRKRRLARAACVPGGRRPPARDDRASSAAEEKASCGARGPPPTREKEAPDRGAGRRGTNGRAPVTAAGRMPSRLGGLRHP